MSAAKGTASSRLLSMKFMQRAAATESPKTTPSTPDGPPAKRVRLSSGFSTPISSSIPSPENEDDVKRAAVMERLAAEAGETRWVLSVQEPKASIVGLNIIQTGFADLDSPSEDEVNYTDGGHKEKFVAGRKVFGTISKTMNRRTNSEDEASDSNSDGVNDEEGDDIDKFIRESQPKVKEKNHRLSEEQAARGKEQKRLAALRRKREVNLNTPTKRDADGDVKLSQLTSISGSGVGTSRPSANSFRPRNPHR